MKKENAFEKFLSTQEGQWISDRLLKILERAQGGVVVFLARKGYWLYRMCRRYADWPEEVLNNVTIVSDRFVAKWEKEEWNTSNTKIFIVDDTVTSGLSLYRIYAKIRNQYPNADIRPVSLFMSLDKKELESRLKTRLGDEEKKYLQDFIKILLICEEVSFEEIGEFSYKQIYMFQEEMVPYVIDLPMVSAVAYDGEKGFTEENHQYVILPTDSFKEMISTYGEWKFEENSYIWEDPDAGIKRVKNRIKCGLFYYRDPNLYSILKDYLLQLVVKCRYEEMEDGNVALVLTPFAIMNSVTYDEIRAVCETLYQGTEFGDWLVKYHDEELSHVLIYRAVVFFLSIYGWKLFEKRFSKEMQGCQLKIDTSIMEENSEEVFIRTVDQLIQTSRLDMTIRIEKIHGGSRVKDFRTIDFRSITGLYDTAYKVLHRYLILRKREEKEDGFITIEEFSDLINDKFSSLYAEERRDLLIGTLTQMLDQSVLGNMIKYRDGVVYRGFRYGENSDIALPFFNSYIFYGVNLLRSKCIDKKMFLDKAEELFQGFRAMLIKNEYMELLFTRADIEINKEYFMDEHADLETLVDNKAFRVGMDRRVGGIEWEIDELIDRIINEGQKKG